MSSLCFFVSTSTAAAQNSQIKQYTTRDGLAGNFVTALAFMPNGSAWVGTTEGATYISDAGWVSYTQAHGLGDNWVTSVVVAPDGRVWLGTQGGGLSVLDPVSRTFETFNLENSEIPSNFVTALAVDGQNRVWVGTLNNGLAWYDVGGKTWTRPELPEEEITAIAVDFDDAPWVGTPNGVYGFDGASWVQDENVGSASVRRIEVLDDTWYLTTNEGRFVLGDVGWVAEDGEDEIAATLDAMGIRDGQITAVGKDFQGRYWLGTPRGILMAPSGNAPEPPAPLPVALVHGWTVAGDDTLETSEFRFLKEYADRDGIPMYYVHGVKPENTLYRNAGVIREEIARIKRESGADKVNLVGFSMGGMNARAYLETTLYGNDVNRVIILGTPQAGVEAWKPILMQQILEKTDQPSAIELSPEYAEMVVNETRAPNPRVFYDLLIGDARQQAGLEFLEDMPASDALITVASSLALDAPNVRKHVNADLHDWGPEAVPLDLTGYLYPRVTWERYLRNALRNGENAPLGAEVVPSRRQPSPLTPLPLGEGDQAARLEGSSAGEGGSAAGNHTPVVMGGIRAGETVTRTVRVDENSSARFVTYYPGGMVDFSLVAPDGRRYEPNDLPQEDESGVLSLSTDIASFSGYVVKNAPVGDWQMILTRTDEGNETVIASTYVVLDAPLYLNSLTRWEQVPLGATNTITGSVRIGTGEIVRDVRMTARIAEPAETPGQPFTLADISLHDDGEHNDGAANDGFFANDFKPSRAGWHLVFVQAEGENFSRASEALFSVNPGDVTLENDEANGGTGAILPPGRIRFDVGVNSARAGEFALAGTLRNAENDMVVARTFIPVHLDGGRQELPVVFDTSRLERAPYVLDVILLDANGAAFELDRATLGGRHQ